MRTDRRMTSSLREQEREAIQTGMRCFRVASSRTCRGEDVRGLWDWSCEMVLHSGIPRQLD